MTAPHVTVSFGGPQVDVIVPVRPRVDVVSDTQQGPPGPQGQPGSAGGALVEVAVLIPTTEVTVVHGFLYHPSVRFVTTDDYESEVTVANPIPGTTVITSVIPMAGTITLS